MIRAGLVAFKLSWKGTLVGNIVDHRGSIGLEVYRREEGEETININQYNASRCMAWEYVVIGVT